MKQQWQHPSFKENCKNRSIWHNVEHTGDDICNLDTLMKQNFTLLCSIFECEI